MFRYLLGSACKLSCDKRSVLKSLLLLTISTSFSSLQARPLIVISGGFGSCYFMGKTKEMTIYPLIQRLSQRIEQQLNIKPIIIESCYAFGNETLYVTAPFLKLQDRAMSRADFFQVVEKTKLHLQKIDGIPETKLYFWGQSHGAWTIMSLLTKNSDTKVNALYTVDPISVENCNAPDFVSGVFVGGYEGCTKFPEDLLPSLKTIRLQAKTWHHWYQTQNRWLHSGPVTVTAETNLELKYQKTKGPLGGSHGLIALDARIWWPFGGQIINEYQGFNRKYRP